MNPVPFFVETDPTTWGPDFAQQIIEAYEPFPDWVLDVYGHGM